MRKLLFVSLVISTGLTAQINRSYDKNLAQKMGADDYGMKNYFFVILKTGPMDSVIKNKPLRDSLFKGHMANIDRLADAGKIVVAGPYGKNSLKYRGLFIMDVKTKEEVLSLLQNDPTIREKIFELEILPWYGSAALPAYLETHKKISKN